MALADNSKNLRVDSGGRLSGDTKLGNGTWSRHMIDLHPKLGNDDGRFDIKGSNFAWGAEELRMDGTTLWARLKNRAGRFVDASIDLGRILKVKDGEFVFMSETERDKGISIGNGEYQDPITALAANARSLRIDSRGQLSGEAKKSDGSWTHHEINLTDRLGNDNGRFDVKGRNFTSAAEAVRVDGTTLRAKLQDRGRRPVEASFDLGLILKVVDGRFVIISELERAHIDSIKNGGKELYDSIKALVANSRNIRVDARGQLSGEAKKNNGSWTRDQIDLNSKLGNNNGRFDIKGNNFAEHAKANETRVEGTTLRALLRNNRQYYDEAFLELAQILKVVDGSFHFRSEYDSDPSVSERSLPHNSRTLLIDNKGRLSGEAKGGNGSWTHDSIDLNAKFGNRDGRFNMDGSNFASNAQSIKLDGTRLWAELKTEGGGIQVDSLELAGILEVVNGRFAFKEEFERRRNDARRVIDSLQGLPGDSSELYINGLGMLSGGTRKKDRSWTTDSINLNPFLGNDRGQFSLDSRNFSNSGSAYKLRGTRLIAQLNNGSSWPSDASLELSLVLRVENGKFVFISKHERQRIISSAFCMFLDDEKQTELHGLCLNKYGKLQPSSIDLNRYYKNNNGSFESNDYGSSGNLSYTAQDFWVEVSSSKILFHAKLRGGRGFEDRDVDLNINIENDNGRFKFVKHDGVLDRDGSWTKFLEGLPIAGYIAALAHYAAGNTEWAKRATAASTNALIVSIGITIGSLIGGPFGAAIGAGIATSIGIAVETEIKKGIRDEGLQGEFEEATVGRYLYETLTAMLTTGATKSFSKWLKKIPLEKFSATSDKLGKAMKYAAKKGGSKEIKKITEKLSEALIKDNLPDDWVKTEKKVEGL